MSEATLPESESQNSAPTQHEAQSPLELAEACPVQPEAPQPAPAEAQPVEASAQPDEAPSLPGAAAETAPPAATPHVTLELSVLEELLDAPPAPTPRVAEVIVPDQPRLLRMVVSALTDMGCVRTNNEDYFGYHDGYGIFVVCDGMGGMASGEVASSRAVTALITSYIESAASGNSVGARLLQAIQEANRDVWEFGQAPQHKGMGTTAVAAALDGNQLIVGNVGDSRAYVLRNGQCAQLTVDHSYINELIRNGTLTVENAHNADLQGMESVICRAVGVAPEIEPDFYAVDLEPGMTILITTDGLTRYLLPDEIAAVIGASPFESACANLINVAKQRGGVDNITCLLLHVLPD
jgi:protein phosphatase